jgi:hypothetical protein
MPEIGGVAEAYGESDILAGHVRVSKIFGCQLHPKFIDDLTKRCLFAPQLAPERAFRRSQAFCHDFEVWTVSDVFDQNFSDPARDTAASSKFHDKIAANLKRGCICRTVTQGWPSVQPHTVQDDLVPRLRDVYGAADHILRQPRFRSRHGDGDRRWHEGCPHYVTHQGNMNANLKFSDKPVESRIDSRMGKGLDVPYRGRSRILE